ncbi:helix-turn-helix transcriptional regulator [Kineosporia sp. A_224]|uniref:helix-turn-helix transcriptional regulator n=1 Tax=Kineosporia sp. A_224 TaxID=1962180 RepID=UPI000B4BC258|nr:helix-turn-helix transcriptional regulator [Kineosporia sp. A_224]
MIRGRDGERARLCRVVDDLAAGRPTAVLVHGDVGSGKSTLLADLVEQVPDDVLVLGATGTESEAELPFSVLSDLLEPVVSGRSRLPGPQEAALSGAIALGPARHGDRLAVCAATRGLLEITAEQRPVLVVVDDVQWVDRASGECIGYAVRRAAGAVSFVLAGRRPDTDLWDRDIPRLAVGPLAAPSARDVLRDVAPDLVEPVADLVLRAAAGNPLALVELPAGLTADQRVGCERIDLPLMPGDRMGTVFGRRVRSLSKDARDVLLLAAADAQPSLAVLDGACRAGGTDLERLAEAETHGLVRVRDDRVEFAHPLVRSAVYRGATSSDRRAAHRALASATSGETRAWHLASACSGPDEAVAAELERTGSAAAARRGYAAASRVLERSAELSIDVGAQQRRLTAAGESAMAAGLSEHAVRLLYAAGRAASAADDRRGALHAERLRGLTLLWTAQGEAAVEVLAALARRIRDQTEPLDRTAAANALADVATALTVMGRPREALRSAEEAAALLGDDDERATRAQVLAVYSWALVLCGEVDRALPVLDTLDRLVEPIDPLSPLAAPVMNAINTRLATGDFERAVRESLAIVDAARHAGALGAVPLPLLVASDATYRTGDWAACEEWSATAVRAAEDSRQSLHLAHVQSIRARLHAARGSRGPARSAIRQTLTICAATGIGSGAAIGHAAAGFVELCQERGTTAIEHLEQVARLASSTGLADHSLLPWASDLVEAYVRVGRHDDAARTAELMADQVSPASAPFVHALVARCRAQVVTGFEAHFERSLALDDLRPVPLDRARTELAFGRRLHRANRRARARVHLRAALTGFERLGAAAWADQSRNELRAAGGRLRERSPDLLTPQEVRVADAAARGGSTRDIAAELFLASKTVEFHLRQVYRKTGVSKRAQLVALLADPARRAHILGREPGSG